MTFLAAPQAVIPAENTRDIVGLRFRYPHLYPQAVQISFEVCGVPHGFLQTSSEVLRLFKGNARVAFPSILTSLLALAKLEQSFRHLNMACAH